MGATGWEYFVPYGADTSAALQQLRERVFLKSSYTKNTTVSKSDYEAMLKRQGSNIQSKLDEIASWAAKNNIPDKVKESLVQQIKQLSDSKASLPKPKTIEELLKQQGAAGTHSILDIIRVSPEPEFGAISPLPASKLVEIFATEKPSHAEIESKYDEGVLEEYICERWQGIYIVAYRDDLPDEIFFAGCSGD